MLSRSEPRSPGRPVITSVGVGAAVFALAQLALPAANLYTTPRFGLVAGIAVGLLALSLGRIRAVSLDAKERQEQDARLDRLIACWPPPKVRQANVYDAGALPSGASNGQAEYVLRPELDGKLRTSLARGGIVVVVGEAGTGKSRSAFHALQQLVPDATLLVPEGPESLAELLELQASELAEDQGPAVLWLDDLTRHLAKLELDALDEWRSAATDLRVVATVRTEDLRELMSSRSEESRNARRLLARSIVVAVPASLSADELKAAAESHPGVDFSGGVGGAFKPGWCDLGPPLYVPEPPPPPPRERLLLRDKPWQAATVGVVACCALLGLLAATGEALKPAPIADQMADRLRELATCSAADMYPPEVGSPRNGDEFFVVVRRSEGCGDSDEIRVYRNRSGRMKGVYRFHPEGPTSGGSYRLVCRGENTSNPCLTRGPGGDPVLLGGWQDKATGTIVPFVLARRGKGHMPVGLDRTDDERFKLRRRYAKNVRIGPREGPWITARPVEDFALLKAPPPSDVQIVFGMATDGPFERPAQIRAFPARVVWGLAPMARSCTYSRPAKRVVGPSFARRVAGTDLPALLRQGWAAAVASGVGKCG